MEEVKRESLTFLTIFSAIAGIMGFAMLMVGVWASISHASWKWFWLIGGLVLYVFHLIEATCFDKTSKYLSWTLTEKAFQQHISTLQRAEPQIKWAIQNWHYEEKKTKDKNGKERTERKRVNTHYAESFYDIQGFLDETLSPLQMLAMFHLLYDAQDEHESLLSPQRSPRWSKPSRSLFLLCEMPLDYRPVDQEEELRMKRLQEEFYRKNTCDTNQEKSEVNLIRCDYQSHVMVILKEGTDNSDERPWWMHFRVYVLATFFLLSLPYRCIFFRECQKITWEVLKHISHRPITLWTAPPQHRRALRRDFASQAYRAVRAELDEGGAGASTPGLASTGAFAGPTSLTVERVETEADVASGVPWYWKNRDLSQGFDEKINLSPGDCQKVQELLDQTFQHKGTRDRKDRLPSRLLVSQVIRMEHSRLWQRFERKKKDLAARVGRPPLISELPGSGAVKTALELPAFAAGPELPAFLKEITRELNEAFLFHGSSPGGALGIGENGFDISRAGSSTGSMFGAGAYLAEASSKSDEYATEDPSGLFGGKLALLLCRTLLGNVFYITESNLRRIQEALETHSFDSILGDREAAIGTYREFVVWDEAQIYPEYVVIYQRHFE
ncbi:Poly [ADP-ribose] polymerase tankyrase (dTNKS) (Poly [ADP-ribose] polymerase) (Protein poly-ADP-ribosyltransferase tankyrase) [Durusdinium trenchii]|uniref:Poly [ADP-ribose] polymerase n=1 Tax=Durusdinium trenchii TaxID=1381693 RepID=A0ABP0J140_9DINO